MGRGSPGTGGSGRKSEEEKRERERERQHTVKRSSGRLGSHSSSFSPSYWAVRGTGVQPELNWGGHWAGQSAAVTSQRPLWPGGGTEGHGHTACPILAGLQDTRLETKPWGCEGCCCQILFQVPHLCELLRPSSPRGSLNSASSSSWAGSTVLCLSIPSALPQPLQGAPSRAALLQSCSRAAPEVLGCLGCRMTCLGPGSGL